MVNVVTITVKNEIAFSDEFLKLKRERKLSATTNDLWRSHFNIKKQSMPQDVAGIEDELRDLAARKALLLQKREEEEKKAEEEKNRFTVIE